MKKIYIITGEPSGDLHASNFVAALNKLDCDYKIYAWGGAKLEAAGATIRKHYRELAFMGFWEVIKNIFTIISNFNYCKKDILDFNPDLVVLVDYPGFNLRMAKWCHLNGFKVVYYISPQIWAWKESRVHDIKKYVDKMYVILPFEKEFYHRWNYPVEFVGHPLLDEIPLNLGNKKTNIIALLPGSRKQEIDNKLPIFLKMIPKFPEYTFVIAGVTHLGETYYQKFLTAQNCLLEMDNTYDLLSRASYALVTSGTATLETALLEVPQIVCYKGSWLNFQLGKRLIKVPFISLVNLIMGKKIVEELIQERVNEQVLELEMKKMIENRDHYKSQYQILKEKLGGPGASERLANHIHHYLN